MKFNEDKYLKFPLCLLNSSKNFNEVLKNILSFSIVVFSKNYKNEDLTFAKEMSGDITESEYAPKDFTNDYDESELMIVCALEYFRIKIDSIVDLQFIYDQMRTHVSQFEKKHGNDAYGKVHRDIFVESLRNEFAGNYTERYFRTLASITAILGTNKRIPFKRITLDRIMYGYYGFKSKKVFEADFTTVLNITKRQLSYVIGKLSDRNLIQKYTLKKRLTYYSTILSFEELLEAIAQYEAKQLKKKKRQIIADNYISKRINEILSKSNFLS